MPLGSPWVWPAEGRREGWVLVPALPTQPSFSGLWTLQPPLECIPLLNCPHCSLSPAAPPTTQPSAEALYPRLGLYTPTRGGGSLHRSEGETEARQSWP